MEQKAKKSMFCQDRESLLSRDLTQRCLSKSCQ